MFHCCDDVNMVESFLTIYYKKDFMIEYFLNDEFIDSLISYLKKQLIFTSLQKYNSNYKY